MEKLHSYRSLAMSYSETKKLDEDSLRQLTEGKGPVDECLCSLLTPPEDSKGIRASIKRAFASFKAQGAIRRPQSGKGGRNTVDVPLTYAQGVSGGLHTTKEVVKRGSSCGQCGCDDNPVVLNHSYANIRITAPDVSSICPCDSDCFPDKAKLQNNIKVTIERVSVDVDPKRSFYKSEQGSEQQSEEGESITSLIRGGIDKNRERTSDQY